MEFFHNISKSQNLQELEHSIFVLQIWKELTTNWKKIPIFWNCKIGSNFKKKLIQIWNKIL